jgi:hypothetical protein
MADVSQNISAQLFVKELPNANRADFNGCKQDFNTEYYTTCDDGLASDTAIENAFQTQLNLTEYYKSPNVFETLKNDYMSKTMDATYETEKVDLNPQMITSGTGASPISLQVGSRDLINGGLKSSFGAMSSSTNTFLIIAIVAVLFYYFKKQS